MANGDDKDRRKQNSSRNERPDIVEKCIGVWSSSTRAVKGSNSKIAKRRICNGVNFVVISKDADLKKVKPAKTRGLLIVVREKEKSAQPPSPKVYDHTYIRVDREEADDKLQKNEDSHTNDTNSTVEQDTSLTERVRDVILMKKTTQKKVEKEKDIEQKKNEIKRQGNGKEIEQREEEKLRGRLEVTEIFWTGFCGIVDRFANCYEITGRVLSYCHPVEKIGQLAGFAERCIKYAGRKFVTDNDDKKKK